MSKSVSMPVTAVFARLADPSKILLFPNNPGRVFSQDGEWVDEMDPYFATALADGSLLRGQPVTLPASTLSAASPET